jgi:hypothetical protein
MRQLNRLPSLLLSSTASASALASHATHTPCAGKLLLSGLLAGCTDAVVDGATLPALQPPAARALHRVWAHGASELIEPGSETSPSRAGLESGRCSLAYGSVWRAAAPVEALLLGAFQSVLASHARFGIPTRISRHDLFHGHLMRARVGDVAMTSVLFHAAEYPTRDPRVLDAPLGHCQLDSDCAPTLHGWRYRNVLWVSWAPVQPVRGGRAAQAVWMLDGAAAAVAGLRVDGSPFGAGCPNTVWEGHLGSRVADVYHLGRGRVWCAHVVQGGAPAVLLRGEH